jgi:hypothetical protein
VWQEPITASKNDNGPAAMRLQGRFTALPARPSRVGKKIFQPQLLSPYFFRPRIQKGRSPGPALARNWAISALNCVNSAWRALTVAASALS